MSYQSRSVIGTVCCCRMSPLYQPPSCLYRHVLEVPGEK